ncbi:MAG: ferritin-like domain-containing protein [Gordonia sp. (in: high G+C Gram-positive bacteria)]|uniref:ferritin-like domain-containing protein n=1 Tax=Gordonia sp. (in: high G+C Gram-positive bacteria) TaxID=84139 RepID=UPI0039E266CB
MTTSPATTTAAHGSAYWLDDFQTAADVRARTADPDWFVGARLTPAIAASLQRFQVGESGDGATLIGAADASGDAEYAAAIRLFVAEEQNHARMIAELLAAGGHRTIAAHWSDAVFVHVRRLLGLRTEVMVLAVAEVIALRYYRALADGGRDRLLTEMSRRILDDEFRHVAFQGWRLRTGFSRTPRVLRRAIGAGWYVFALAVAAVVASDHGPALADCGVGRGRFIADCAALFRSFADQAFRHP